MTVRPVVVCGSDFGAFHAEAVARHPRLRLTHVLAHGSARSRALADAHGATLLDDVAQVPDGIGLACVAVGSGIQGGAGTTIATALLERGVPVLQEHPIHPDELTGLVRTARRAGTLHAVNLHYRHVWPVPEFLRIAARVRERQRPTFVDVVCPVHLLLPVVDILCLALGALRPVALGSAVSGSGPFDQLEWELDGVPVSMRVLNRFAPADRDNHAGVWPRLAIGFPAGVLTLADLHGPVEWAPRLHLPPDGLRRFTGGAGTRLTQRTVGIVPGTEPGTFAEVFERRWPEAIGATLDAFLLDLDERRDALRRSAVDLATARLWVRIADAIGAPRTIDPSPPELLDPEVVFGHDALASDDDDEHAWTAYDGEAEFFDLAAREHVETSSGPAVLAALATMPEGPGPILELGAGTGLLTALVARATGARVWACEPAAGMRAALFARVVDDDLLRAHVSVFADDALGLEVPERVRAVLLCGVLGHLADDAHDALWARLRECLADDAPVVVELMGMTRAATVEPTALRTVTVGAQRYRWVWGAVPDGDDVVRMTSTWSVQRDEQPVREHTTEHRWRTLSLEDVRAVAARHGFEMTDDLTTDGTPLGLFRLRERTPVDRRD